MNCSQKLISLIFGTTKWICYTTWLGCELLSKVDIFDIRNNLTQYKERSIQLWIALKSWYLWYSEQRVVEYDNRNISCELLSKVDIFDIRNNSNEKSLYRVSVVNCSQKLISLIFGTTKISSKYIAFSVVNCSQKLISLIFGTTSVIKHSLIRFVVNCSQKLISLIFGTTRICVSWYVSEFYSSVYN